MSVKYVVSACLAGCKCRYDGKDNLCPKVAQLVQEGKAVTVCPEVMGGLPTPRVPSEQRGNKIFNKIGEDNTEFFIKGSEEALKIVKKYNIKVAILKAKSPSCGSRKIYDGTFTRTLIEGQGVFAKELTKMGIKIYEEGDDLSEL